MVAKRHLGLGAMSKEIIVQDITGEPVSGRFEVSEGLRQSTGCWLLKSENSHGKSVHGATRAEATRMADEWWAHQKGLRQTLRTEVAVGRKDPTPSSINGP